MRDLRRLFILLTAVACCLTGGAQNPGDKPKAEGPSGAEAFEGQIRPLLTQYCVVCHSTEKKKGDLDLEVFSTLDAVKRQPKVWQAVAEQFAHNEMPPKGKPQPTPAEKERLSSWVAATLREIARAQAGDPGPVVLRRLSNAEFTYTIHDLTGVESLRPAREFPVDGAAGEGFTNTGQGLVMSPSLVTKYLDAGKEVAGHAVLLPDGIRFSAQMTRRDWTEEILAQIRGFYREFTDPRAGGERVNLQGIVFDTNQGGRLPLERYLAAMLEEREALAAGRKTVEAVARERGLSPKYAGALLAVLSGNTPSPLLDPIRRRWNAARPGDAAALSAGIGEWQKATWKFNSVGHIGKVGGPKAWMEPVNPLVSKQELRLKIPAAPAVREVTLYLVASDAGDGNEGDFVVWQQPRFVAPGRPDLPLRDVREVSIEFARRRELVFASAAKCLVAAAEVSEAQGRGDDVAELARRHGVDADVLRSWLDFLGLGGGGPVKIDSYLAGKISGASGHDFINGWGKAETPNLVANSSDQHVRIPGNMKPHSVAVHPSPKLRAAVGWRSPAATKVRAEATVTHAHPECGNGVTWSLELRRGDTRRRLAAGTAQGEKAVKVGPVEGLDVRPGDLISLLIGPRNGDHACDLTAVELVLTSGSDGGRTWSLSADVSPDVLAGNPHADRFGNEAVWHFYTEPDAGSEGGHVIPAGSLLAKWQAAANAEEKRKLAGEVQKLLTSGPPAAPADPDAKLYRELAAFGGPLLPVTRAATRPAVGSAPKGAEWGLDPATFGRRHDGQPIDPQSLCVRAPSVIEIRLPADFVAERELVVTGTLDRATGAEGSVQLRVLTTNPEQQAGLLGGTPVLVNENTAARRRYEAAFDEFRRWFPPALCYTKIVPVDEVVTLTLFHREDDHLARLMLDDAQKANLDRLWAELRYVSQDALALVDAFAQLMEYATQDADPKVFEPLRKPINDRAAALRQWLIDTEPKHLEAVLELAGRAYRRPLAAGEKDELRELYRKLRGQGLPHDEAIRLTIARILTAPAFLYRPETPGPGAEQVPVSDWELASRLSYFLWSSMPDAELRQAAAAGKLRDPDTLAVQAQRMLRDERRVRRLATEFACQWVHVYGFDEFDEKSERHFPTFGGLRQAMYEEAIRFFADLFVEDRQLLSVLDADYTFLNGPLAAHYGIPGVAGEQWRRVEGVKKYARGGVLGLGATLAKQSGASRTSPILRGNWVAEVLLGDKLPRPPKGVPTLPEDESAETLTVRELTERHSRDPACANCHSRIDAFGFSLEGFDAIGRHRDRDLAGRPIDARAVTLDGARFEGIDGLREYLLTKRRDAFLRQFCRKLLGYALGRAVQLSDEPLLDEMKARLESNGYHVRTAVEMIVQSKQFREIRGRRGVYETPSP